MRRKLFNKQRDYAFVSANWQKNFNNLIRNYNEEFLFFLHRAASGYYNRLLASGRVLKDLYEMVIFMQNATGLLFEVTPLPFTFRHGSEYYRALGFDDEEITNIQGFFDHVKETFNKDFEECIKEDTQFLSSKSTYLR